MQIPCQSGKQIKLFFLKDIFAGLKTALLLIQVCWSQRDVHLIELDIPRKTLWMRLVPGCRRKELLPVPVELEII